MDDAPRRREKEPRAKTRRDTPEHLIERIRKPPVGSSSLPVGSVFFENSHVPRGRSCPVRQLCSNWREIDGRLKVVRVRGSF